MNIFDFIDKDCVEFIHIDRVVTDASGSKLLEYFVWLKPVDLDITGFKILQEISEACDNLIELQNINVPCNYTVLDLHNQDILSVISCKESVSSKVLGSSNCIKIELKFPDNNVYKILYNIINSGSSISVEGSPGFSSAKNIHFNKDNLDIVWRYYNEEDGFRSYHVYKNGIMPNMYVRSIVDLPIPNFQNHRIQNGKIEYMFNPSKVSKDAPELYVDGRLMPTDYSIVLLSMETLTLHYCKYFSSEITQKVCDALYQYLSGEQPIKFSRGERYQSSKQNKICSIFSPYPTVKTSNIRKTFESIKFDPSSQESLIQFAGLAVKMYGESVAEQIMLTLVSYVGKSKEEIITISKIVSMEQAVKRAKLGLQAAGLKEVFSKSKLFNKIYLDGVFVYESCVFENYKICVQNYEDTRDLQMRLIMQGL